MNILIAGAWPYANGSLHIGHLAALLPGDVLARYHRAKGDRVCYVSGSDCHGTPVTQRARQEGCSPAEVAARYHREFTEVFRKLGFTYDRYGATTDREHIAFVRDFHRRMYERDYIYEKTAPEAYCPRCETVLADRMMTGKCPECGAAARGDQCDSCGAAPEILVDPVCTVCGTAAVITEAKHLYLAVSKLEPEIRRLLDSHPEWRRNAVAFTKRYLNEGLRDRAVTRKLDWGIDVPKEGYGDHKIYIWAENVLGYLSMSAVAGYEDMWHGEAKHYYVHGKDNIPFHTVILPALLLANGGGWHLPDVIVSSEHLTLEGRKISTSQNHAIWVKDIVDTYHPDSLRYFFLANNPEKRDADFNWEEFKRCHNGGLLGGWGNLVNRTLAFAERYLGGVVPDGKLDPDIGRRIREAYQSVGEKLETGSCRDALREAFELVRAGNKYFDDTAPWQTRHSDPDACRDSIFTCIQLVANLAALLHPFLPFTSEKAEGWLGIAPHWEPQRVEAGQEIPRTEVLFERIN